MSEETEKEAPNIDISFGEKALTEAIKQSGESYRDTSGRMIDKVSSFLEGALEPHQIRRVSLAKADEIRNLTDADVERIKSLGGAVAEVDTIQSTIDSKVLVEMAKAEAEAMMIKSEAFTQANKKMLLTQTDLDAYRIEKIAEAQSKSLSLLARQKDEILDSALARERQNFIADQINIEEIANLAAKKLENRGIKPDQIEDVQPSSLRAAVDAMKGSDDGDIRELWAEIIANGLEHNNFPSLRVVDTLKYLDGFSAKYFEGVGLRMFFCNTWSPILEEQLHFMVSDKTHRVIEQLVHLSLISPIPTRDMTVGNIRIQIDRHESITSLPSYQLTVFGRELLMSIRPSLEEFREVNYVKGSTDYEGLEKLLENIVKCWGRDKLVFEISQMMVAFSRYREHFSISYRNFGIFSNSRRYSSQSSSDARDISPGALGGEIVEEIIATTKEMFDTKKFSKKARQDAKSKMYKDY